MNEPIGPVRIGEAGAVAADGIGHANQRVFLSDHALAQALLHVHQFLGFAFEQAADGNAGPLADQRGDVLFVHFFLEHAAVLLRLGQLLLRLVELALGGHQLAVTDLGHARQIAGTLGALFLRLELLDVLFQLANRANGVLLDLPAGLARVGLLAQIGQFRFDFAQARWSSARQSP